MVFDYKYSYWHFTYPYFAQLLLNFGLLFIHQGFTILVNLTYLTLSNILEVYRLILCTINEYYILVKNNSLLHVDLVSNKHLTSHI